MFIGSKRPYTFLYLTLLIFFDDLTDNWNATMQLTDNNRLIDTNTSSNVNAKERKRSFWWNKDELNCISAMSCWESMSLVRIRTASTSTTVCLPFKWSKWRVSKFTTIGILVTISQTYSKKLDNFMNKKILFFISEMI